MKKSLWLFTAISVFGCLLATFTDILMFFIDPSMMITPNIQRWVGGDVHTMRGAMMGFICGALLVHFTRWGSPEFRKTK